jgi:hypothetical protein
MEPLHKGLATVTFKKKHSTHTGVQFLASSAEWAVRPPNFLIGGFTKGFDESSKPLTSRMSIQG